MAETLTVKVAVKQNDQKENLKKRPANEQHAQPWSLSAPHLLLTLLSVVFSHVYHGAFAEG